MWRHSGGEEQFRPLQQQGKERLDVSRDFLQGAEPLGLLRREWRVNMAFPTWVRGGWWEALPGGPAVVSGCLGPGAAPDLYLLAAP